MDKLLKEWLDGHWDRQVSISRRLGVYYCELTDEAGWGYTSHSRHSMQEAFECAIAAYNMRAERERLQREATIRMLREEAGHV